MNAKSNSKILQLHIFFDLSSINIYKFFLILMKVYATVETKCVHELLDKGTIQLITQILMNSLFSSDLVNNNQSRDGVQHG